MRSANLTTGALDPFPNQAAPTPVSPPARAAFAPILHPRGTHRKVQGEDSDVGGQEHIERLLRIPPATAVAVAVHHARQLRYTEATWPEVAALQLLPRPIPLQHSTAQHDTGG